MSSLPTRPLHHTALGGSTSRTERRVLQDVLSSRVARSAGNLRNHHHEGHCIHRHSKEQGWAMVYHSAPACLFLGGTLAGTIMLPQQAAHLGFKKVFGGGLVSASVFLASGRPYERVRGFQAQGQLSGPGGGTAPVQTKTFSGFARGLRLPHIF